LEDEKKKPADHFEKQQLKNRITLKQLYPFGRPKIRKSINKQ
jgi:hypothetical protein